MRWPTVFPQAVLLSGDDSAALAAWSDVLAAGILCESEGPRPCADVFVLPQGQRGRASRPDRHRPGRKRTESRPCAPAEGGRRHHSERRRAPRDRHPSTRKNSNPTGAERAARGSWKSRRLTPFSRRPPSSPTRCCRPCVRAAPSLPAGRRRRKLTGDGEAAALLAPYLEALAG